MRSDCSILNCIVTRRYFLINVQEEDDDMYTLLGISRSIVDNEKQQKPNRSPYTFVRVWRGGIKTF